MKNLELCNYGVQEMNAVEMKETEGGFWQFIIGAIIGGIVYDVAKEAWVDAATGYINYSASTTGAYVIHTQH